MEKKEPKDRRRYPNLSFDLLEMLVLYGSGKWSPSMLARKYGKQLNTIIYWLTIYFLDPDEWDSDMSLMKYQARKDVPTNHQEISKYQHLIEDYSPGKSYKQYLKDAMSRPVERGYITTYGVALTEFTLPKEEKRGVDNAPSEPENE